MKHRNIFDDYKERQKFKQVELEFSNKIDKVFNALEISSILEKIISLYYKTSLIHSLSIYFNANGDLSNLIVSKKEISIESIPKNSIISVENDIEFIYKSGLSISLAPNKFHNDTDILFTYFSKLNGFLFDWNEKKAIPIKKIKDYIRVLQNHGLAHALQTIQKEAEEKIFAKQTRRILREYSEKLTKELGINSEENDSPKPKSNLNGFFDNIISKKIPVVSIAHPYEREYQILCYRHLASNLEVDNFDVKKIFHESPTTFQIILAGAYIVPMLSALHYIYSQYLKTQKALLEIEKLKSEIKKSKKSEVESETVKTHLKIIQGTIDNASIIESKYKTHLLQSIEKVENLDLKQNLQRCIDSIEKSYIDLISFYDLQLQSFKEI